jgi:hypothetical protein
VLIPSTSVQGWPLLPKEGEVLVSNTVKDLVAGAGVEFEDRGMHVLKGMPGRRRVYAVTGFASDA